MENSRQKFVNALKFCKRNKQTIIDNIIATNFMSKNFKDFWQNVNKSKNGHGGNKSLEIDGKTHKD